MQITLLESFGNKKENDDRRRPILKIHAEIFATSFVGYF